MISFLPPSVVQGAPSDLHFLNMAVTLATLSWPTTEPASLKEPADDLEVAFARELVVQDGCATLTFETFALTDAGFEFEFPGASD